MTINHSCGCIIIQLRGNHYTWLPGKLVTFKVTLEVYQHNPDKVGELQRIYIRAPFEAYTT